MLAYGIDGKGAIWRADAMRWRLKKVAIEGA
jgi:hypothetical protein